MTPPPTETLATAGPPGPAVRRVALRRPATGRLADRAYLGGAAAASLLAVVLVGYLITRTLQQTGEVWSTFGVWGFLTGTEWIPFPADGGPGVFGALPFIYGTVVTSAIALVLAVPLAIGVALATTVFLPRRVRGPVSAIVDLLAAVPSVVFGFWGIVVLVPAARPALEWIAEHNLRFLGIIALAFLALALAVRSPGARVLGAVVGGGLAGVIALTLAGVLEAPFTLLEGPVTSGSFVMSGLVLAVMILPIIAALTREVIATVPVDQQEAAYALGATRWEMVRHSVLPWARSGIVGASALGLGRALGETIALALVLGNSPNILSSLLGPGATAASVIAVELNEASELQLASLTALAVVLFGMTFLINVLARVIVRRGGAGSAAGGRLRTPRVPPAGERPAGGTVAVAERRPPAEIPQAPREVSRERRVRSRVAETLIIGSVAVAMIPLGLILAEMVRQGLPLVLEASFWTGLPPTDVNDTTGAGISNALVGTLIITGIAVLLAAPLAVLTALFMNEIVDMGRWPRRIANAIGLFVDVLLGMPSVVAGLTVYIGLVLVMEKYTALAGGIALAVVMFPIVVRAADEVLRLVPRGQKEAALALGAPRWRTVWSVVLPAAAPGILTGVVLAVARATGETAPILFTALGSQFFSTDLLEPIAALPQVIFFYTIGVRTDQSVEFAWAATLVLVGFILALNLLARLISRLTRATEAR